MKPLPRSWTGPVMGVPAKPSAVSVGAPDHGVSTADVRIRAERWDAHFTRTILKRVGGNWVRETRSMTEREILQKDFRVLDRDGGHVVASCRHFDWSPEKRIWERRGLTPLLEGAEVLSVPCGKKSSERHAHAPEHFTRSTHRARVIRHVDHKSESLRAELEDRLATGKGNARKKREIPMRERGEVHETEVVAEARKLTRRHAKGSAIAKELRVPLTQVQDGDIVVSVGHPPRKWFGES